MGFGGVGVPAQVVGPDLIAAPGKVHPVGALLRRQHAVCIGQSGVGIHQVDLLLLGQLGDEGIVDGDFLVFQPLVALRFLRCHRQQRLEVDLGVRLGLPHQVHQLGVAVVEALVVVPAQLIDAQQDVYLAVGLAAQCLQGGILRPVLPDHLVGTDGLDGHALVGEVLRPPDAAVEQQAVGEGVPHKGGIGKPVVLHRLRFRHRGGVVIALGRLGPGGGGRLRHRFRRIGGRKDSGLHGKGDLDGSLLPGRLLAGTLCGIVLGAYVGRQQGPAPGQHQRQEQHGGRQTQAPASLGPAAFRLIGQAAPLLFVFL